VNDARATYDATLAHRETARAWALQAAYEWRAALVVVTALEVTVEDPK
jgi:hypothetical protein